MKKNTWKKMVLAGAGLTLAGSVLVACSNSSSNSSSSSSSKTIKLWVPTGAKESYSEVVKQFEEESGYTVKVVESNDSKAQENVKKDPEKAADVFSLPHDQLGQLVESGVIQEVPEEYANEIAENDTDQAVAGAQYNGKTYAFPFGIESQVLFYNKSKLSEEDVTNYETITSKATFGATFKSMKLTLLPHFSCQLVTHCSEKTVKQLMAQTGVTKLVYLSFNGFQTKTQTADLLT